MTDDFPLTRIVAMVNFESEESVFFETSPRRTLLTKMPFNQNRSDPPSTLQKLLL